MNSQNSKNEVQAFDGEGAVVVEAEKARPTHDKVQAFDGEGAVEEEKH